MQADRSSAARRAPWRARVAARLRAERGDTLIEVVIGALMVALIATASLGGFGAISKLTGSQRNEQQAAALAQQDQARLRGLTIAQLAGSAGNQTATTVLDGTTYTVTSTSRFISGATGADACNGQGADEVQTTSSVVWGRNNANGGRTPVVVHGLITPAEGGSLVASVDTTASFGLTGTTPIGAAGATISISGPTAASPVTVDSTGCAIFTGLTAGSYTVSYTMPPSGTWLTQTGSSTIPSTTMPVTSSGTTTVPTVYVGQPGAIQATFQTIYAGAVQAIPSASDQFVLSSPSGLASSPQIVGTDSTKTNSTFATTLTSPTTILPYDPSVPSNLITPYAGSCTADLPTGTYAPTGVAVPAAGTTAVTLSEPAMVIKPYSGTASGPGSYTWDDPVAAPLTYSSSGWTHSTGLTGPYNGTDSTSATTGKTLTVVLPLGANSVTYYYTKKSSYGKATIALSPTVSGSVTSVDQFSSTTSYKNSTTISSSLVPTTQYTLTITVSGTKNTSSTGTTISVDQLSTNQTVTYSTGPLLTTKPTVTLTDTGCSNNEDWPPTRIPDATWGALQYPGVPWGTYSVCVDDGTNHYTQTVSNKSWSPAVVNAYIYPGAAAPPGGGTGYGTGTCP